MTILPYIVIKIAISTSYGERMELRTVVTSTIIRHLVKIRFNPTNCDRVRGEKQFSVKFTIYQNFVLKFNVLCCNLANYTTNRVKFFTKYLVIMQVMTVQNSVQLR